MRAMRGSETHIPNTYGFKASSIGHPVWPRHFCKLAGDEDVLEVFREQGTEDPNDVPRNRNYPLLQYYVHPQTERPASGF